MKSLLATISLLAFSSYSLASSEAAEVIFTCTWQNEKPIKITVNPSKGIATRDDGGSKYNVIKITKYAVWLEVSQPKNQAGIAIQMIQRGEAVNNKAGKWVDVVMSMNGTVSPIAGGVCWEK